MPSNLVLQRLDLPVRTARLSLRPADLDDAEFIWRYRRLDSVSRWLTEVPRSLDDHRSRFDPDRLGRTLIIEREGRIVGDLMLKLESPWAQAEVEAQARDVQAELGWVLDPAHTGSGYATEAVRELMRLCFDELHLRRVVAFCFADNETSWRLMERVGMRRELHAVRESLHRSGSGSTSSATRCSPRSGAHMSDQRRAEAAELAEALRAAARFRPDPDRPPVVLALPFTNSWMAVNTPARRVPSHGTHFGGQTYALDFVAVDERRRTSEVRDWRTFLTAEPAEWFSGFGQPILAPADGRVVAVHDGEPDLTARRSPIVAVPYLLTQGSRLRQGFQAVVGNHVIIELDEPGRMCCWRTSVRARSRSPEGTL